MAMAEKFESELILLQVVTPVSRLVARMVPGQVTPATTVQIGAEVAREQVEAEMARPGYVPRGDRILRLTVEPAQCTISRFFWSDLGLSKGLGA